MFIERIIELEQIFQKLSTKSWEVAIRSLRKNSFFVCVHNRVSRTLCKCTWYIGETRLTLYARTISLKIWSSPELPSYIVHIKLSNLFELACKSEKSSLEYCFSRSRVNYGFMMPRNFFQQNLHLENAKWKLSNIQKRGMSIWALLSVKQFSTTYWNAEIKVNRLISK